MEAAAKGTVTPLASMFSAKEVDKAAKRVEEKIEEKRTEMERLNHFVADNTDLINLVRKLPDQLHHDIMVPFGKVAFFPGRLMHTNEFVVLLGENYYVERTSKQTVDILKRRGKTLTSQVNSLNAMIQDLEVEASFFSATASEAAEGLVEIREDYVKPVSSERECKSGILNEESSSLPGGDNAKTDVSDDEFEHMMSKLDELEREELAGESEDEMDEDEQSSADESDSESDNDVDNDEDRDEDSEDEKDEDEQKGLDQRSLDHKPQYSEEFQSSKSSQRPRDKSMAADVLANKSQQWEDNVDRLNCTGLALQPFREDETSRSSSMLQNVGTSKSIQIASMVPEGKAKTETFLSQKNELPAQKSKPEFDSSKAFTGSIVERSLQENTTTPSQSSGSQPQKPVSRFKMQRR